MIAAANGEGDISDLLCPRLTSDTHFNPISPSEVDTLGILHGASKVIRQNGAVCHGTALPIPSWRDRLKKLTPIRATEMSGLRPSAYIMSSGRSTQAFTVPSLVSFLVISAAIRLLEQQSTQTIIIPSTFNHINILPFTLHLKHYST